MNKPRKIPSTWHRVNIFRDTTLITIAHTRCGKTRITFVDSEGLGWLLTVRPGALSSLSYLHGTLHFSAAMGFQGYILRRYPKAEDQLRFREARVAYVSVVPREPAN